MRFQFKLIPTLMVVPALIVIFGLAIWQTQRLQWKEDLIEKMESRALSAPTSLPHGALNAEETEFLPFSVTGHFDHSKEIYLVNRSLNGNPGVHVYTPFIRSDATGTEPEVLLVNRGWAPFEGYLPKDRPEGQIEGEVTVTGLLRFPKGTNMFIPANEPENNVWFYIDQQQAEAFTGYKLADYYILSNDDQVPGGFPLGKQWHLNISNNHLQYAITWFLLGISLLTIFLIFSYKKEENDQNQGPESEAK